MQFIIFDLEATCWPGNQDFRQQEIIEIGAIKSDHYGHRLSEFQTFVKPRLFPDLSPYCVQLTGISQSEVDSAPDFGRAVSRFRSWFADDDETCLLCSWGGRDRELLEDNCKLFGLDVTWLEDYIDLKAQYHQLNNMSRLSGLKKTLKRESLAFEGNHHRALDDANNLFNLFRKYRDVWMY